MEQLDQIERSPSPRFVDVIVESISHSAKIKLKYAPMEKGTYYSGFMVSICGEGEGKGDKVQSSLFLYLSCGEKKRGESRIGP